MNKHLMIQNHRARKESKKKKLRLITEYQTQLQILNGKMKIFFSKQEVCNYPISRSEEEKLMMISRFWRKKKK